MRLAVPIALLVMLTGCAGNPAPGTGETAKTEPGSDLWATSWRLVEVQGAAALEGIEATLEFPEPGRVAGNGSCNRFSGSVEVTGNSVMVRQLAATRKACIEPAANRQEVEYLRALEASGRYSIQGDVLELSSARGAPPLRFRRAGS
jgi:heat shock protein HslJ